MAEPESRVILLVEDNFDDRTIYQLILEHSGFRVVEARDGAAAIEQAREWLPALVLMDVCLPGIDGLEVTRRIKADAATRHIPVLALTAHTTLSDQQSADEAGCDGYMIKPVAPSRVLAEVRRLLGAAPRTGQAPPA